MNQQLFSMKDRSDRLTWQSCLFKADDDDHNLATVSGNQDCSLPHKLGGSMNYDDTFDLLEDMKSHDNTDILNETTQITSSSHLCKSNTKKSNISKGNSSTEKRVSSQARSNDRGSHWSMVRLALGRVIWSEQRSRINQTLTGAVENSNNIDVRIPTLPLSMPFRNFVINSWRMNPFSKI